MSRDGDGKITIGYPEGWDTQSAVDAGCVGSPCETDPDQIMFVSDTGATIEKEVSSIPVIETIPTYVSAKYPGVEFILFSNTNVTEAYVMKEPASLDATKQYRIYIFRTGTTLLTLTATYGKDDTTAGSGIDTIMKSVVVK